MSKNRLQTIALSGSQEGAAALGLGLPHPSPPPETWPGQAVPYAYLLESDVSLCPQLAGFLQAGHLTSVGLGSPSETWGTYPYLAELTSIKGRGNTSSSNQHHHTQGQEEMLST